VPIDAGTRVSLAMLAKLFDWRSALVVVHPATVIRWHRAGWRLPWRIKSRRGRRPIPAELRALIRRVANENPLWGEERIGNELLLKLGIRISPRTVRKYMPKRPRGHPRGDQRWSTFLKNHATAILAFDFFVAVLGESSAHKYLIHDRDAIYARHLDTSIRALGLEVLRFQSQARRRTRFANDSSERFVASASTG
jgi:putative transposase